jgi:steroid 5-alpha reductase family enzyme
LLLGALVAVWAMRLGSFSVYAGQAGRLGRALSMRSNPRSPRFFMVWNLQGLWVFLTLSAALAAMTAVQRQPMETIALLGMLVFASGFVIEVVADRQKRSFRADPANEGQLHHHRALGLVAASELLRGDHAVDRHLPDCGAEYCPAGSG